MGEYDVTLKTVLQRLLRGGVLAASMGIQVERWLGTELPKVRNRRVDLLGETANRELVHIELQSRNEDDLALRMAEYALDIVRQHGRYPRQLVLYAGPDQLKMSCGLAWPGMTYSFELVDMRDFDAEPLLASTNLEENILAILCRVRNQRETVRHVLKRIASGSLADRDRAMNELTLISGLRHCGSIIREEVSSMPILEDIMDHDLLGPAIRKGMAQGTVSMLHAQLQKKYGGLPAWVDARLATMSTEELQAVGLRMFDAGTFEELFR